MVYMFPGFPEETSEELEMPDVGELLMSPAFQGIGPEAYLVHATDFQRYLFSKVPLRNDKKYVLIRSGVWLLEPGTRSHVTGVGNWHIDIEGTDGQGDVTTERFFILSSPCSCLTEFNVNPLAAETSLSEPNQILRQILTADPGALEGRPIEPNRIYTIQNHIHRAVDPKRIEFRFFFRVVETNASCPWSNAPLKQLQFRSCHTGEITTQLTFEENALRIAYPRAMTS